jgi:hypothetical protein
LGPHDDALTLELGALLWPLGPGGPLVLELLPQAATAIMAPTTTTATMSRTRGTC